MVRLCCCHLQKQAGTHRAEPCSVLLLKLLPKPHRSAGLGNGDAVTAAGRRPVPGQEVKLPGLNRGRRQEELADVWDASEEELADVRDASEGSGGSRVGGWASPVLTGELNPPR